MFRLGLGRWELHVPQRDQTHNAMPDRSQEVKTLLWCCNSGVSLTCLPITPNCRTASETASKRELQTIDPLAAALDTMHHTHQLGGTFLAPHTGWHGYLQHRSMKATCSRPLCTVFRR